MVTSGGVVAEGRHRPYGSLLTRGGRFSASTSRDLARPFLPSDQHKSSGFPAFIKLLKVYCGADRIPLCSHLFQSGSSPSFKTQLTFDPWKRWFYNYFALRKPSYDERLCLFHGLACWLCTLSDTGMYNVFCTGKYKCAPILTSHSCRQVRKLFPMWTNTTITSFVVDKLFGVEIVSFGRS